MQRLREMILGGANDTAAITEAAELLHQRKHRQWWIQASQYAVLGMSGYLFLKSSILSLDFPLSLSVALMGLYGERGAAMGYEKWLSDPETAKYIIEHSSSLTKFSYFCDSHIIKAFNYGANWTAEKVAVKIRSQ